MGRARAPRPCLLTGRSAPIRVAADRGPATRAASPVREGRGGWRAFRRDRAARRRVMTERQGSVLCKSASHTRA
eukprot:208170-Chlamydomonas_euryale.AAC.7